MQVFARAYPQIRFDGNSKLSVRIRNDPPEPQFPLGLLTIGFRIRLGANSKVVFP